MSLRQAVLLPDGGPDVGLGHLVRCYALAEALVADGWSCAVAIKAASLGGMCFVQRPNLELWECPEVDGWTLEALAQRRPEGVDLVVIDDYGRDAQFERSLKPWARQSLVIDDMLDRVHDCDWLAVAAPPAGQPLPSHCRLLLGPAYTPLRREFWLHRLRHVVSAHREDLAVPAKSTILINLGGTQQSDLLRLILQDLVDIQRPLHIQLVAAGAEAFVRALTKTTPHLTFEAMPVSNQMAELLTRADLVIGAAGSSAWERAALGVPAVSLVIADNQLSTAALLESCSAAVILDCRQGIVAGTVGAAVRSLIDNSDRTREIANRAAVLADGLGARRIVQQIAPERAADDAAVILRPATEADIRIVYNWQSHPTTRRYANNPAIPTWSEHERWFAARLSDPRCLFNIIEHDGTAAGTIRLDLGHRDGEVSATVSIFIAQEKKRRGIALAALRAIRRLVPELTLHAEIDPRNEASLRLFRSAGYRQVSDRWHVNTAAA